MAAIQIVQHMIFFCLLAVNINGLTFSHMTNRDVVTVYTTPNIMTDWSQFSIVVTDRDFFSFQVRACAEAHVLIESIIGMTPDRQDHLGAKAQSEQIVATEVAFGAKQNSMVSVMKPSPTGGDILTEIAVPNTLDCTDFRQFWISWKNQTLKVGRGPIYDQEVYLKVISLKTRFIGVSKLFLATTGGNSGVWRIDENSGYSSLVRTNPTGLFSSVWRSVEFRSGWLPLDLKASGSAMIGLGAQSGFADYVITLGLTANTSIIEKNGETVAKLEEPNVLDMRKFLPLWISWDYGLVQVGRGREKNENILLSYQDKAFQNVGHIGFTTTHGVSGEWAIRETAENNIMTTFPLVPGQTDAELFISAPMSTYVPFHIQACSDAQIHFTQKDGWDDDSAINVLLGAKNNTEIIIGMSFSPNITTIPKPGLLDCDSLVPFWASWGFGPLRIGQGLWEEQYVIMEFNSFIVSRLHSISFSNGRSDVPVKVTVDNSIGDELVITMSPTLEYGKMFVSTKHSMFRTFKLAHKGGAKILLAETFNNDPMQRYEVVFAMNGTMITLQRTHETGSHSNTTAIPVPLQDSDRRPFWLSWYNNVIMVGEGHRYGERTLVKFSDGDPYTVNALSFATSNSTFANLDMDMDQDELLSMTIPAGSKAGVRWFRLSEHHNWAYVRLANDGVARLSLSTWYRSEKDVEYMLTFGEGGKNKVVLTQKTNQVASSAILQTWNKQDLRDFWISWEDNKLSVGGSRYKGADPYFSGYALTEQLRAIGFYSETNSTSEWLIPHAFGPEATVYTDSDVVGETWFQVTHKTGLVFGVQACRNANVTLAGSMYGADTRPYLVEIGATNNVNTHIWADGVQKMGTQTKDILSCNEERYFWITWHDGAIVVGAGQEPGYLMLVSWHSLTPNVINAVTVSTSNSTGKWRLGFLGGSLDPKPPPPPTKKPSTSNGLGAGAIAGIVIGSLLLLLIIMAVIGVVLKGVPGPIRRMISPPSAGEGPGLPVSDDQSFENPIQNRQDDYGGE